LVDVFLVLLLIMLAVFSGATRTAALSVFGLFIVLRAVMLGLELAAVHTPSPVLRSGVTR
jgi:hypothetical protein